MNKRSSIFTILTMILPLVMPAAFFAASVLFFSAQSALAAPFPCTGEAFMIQQDPAELFEIDQAVTPFVFSPVGSASTFQINNLGFRRSDGLLYGYRGDHVIVTIDDTGASAAASLGLGGLPSAGAGTVYNAGDVSADGSEMYFTVNGVGSVHTIDLPVLTLANTAAITGGTGLVLDWAAHPSNGLLYGGDRTDGELAELDPVTGVRTDKVVAGGPLPTGTSFGAAWFNAAGTLFLYLNTGTIYEISGPDTATPTLEGTESGEVSPGFNDGAACIQDVIGVAKQMSTAGGGLPTTVTLDYEFENFSAGVFNNLTADEDLTAVFGTHGVGLGVGDWEPVLIIFSPGFANADFNGHSDTELIAAAATLTAGEVQHITVMLTLKTPDAAVPDPAMMGPDRYINQILLEGDNPGGITYGDFSTSGNATGGGGPLDPDTDGNGSPDERFPAYITVDDIGVETGPDLVKTGALDLGGDGVANPGDLINYTFTVTNTSGGTFTSVVVTDPLVPVITCPSGNPIPTLAPAAMETCTGSYAITQADVDAGQKDNTATADSNETLPLMDGHMEPIPQGPGLSLVKTATPLTYSAVGDVISYSYLVTNSGNVTISQPITIDDDHSTDESCPAAPAILAPGGTITCTASHTVTQADMDAGSVTNVATASGTDPGSNPVTSPPDTETVTTVQSPALSLVKTATPLTYSAVGDVISYSFLVTNSGNVTISQPITVDDDLSIDESCPAGDLAPGASTTCTASYTITQADMDAGSVTNVATASGTDPVSNPVTSPTDTETVTAVQSPALSIVKNGALDLGGDGVANPGDLINYTFTVTNTGNVTLTDVLISDPMVSPITCPSGNPIPTLAVMDSEICTGSYAITQADIKAGQRDNTATADSNETPPVTGDHTEVIPQGPGLELVKDGALDLGGDGVANPGDVINYEFTVTNTGNVTLTDVLVSDLLVPVITCPSGNPIPTLAVGDSETCTGSYAITQADIDAGERANTATAESNETPPVTDDHTELIPQDPGLDLVKDGALDLGGDGIANPGDLIYYTFTVTNTGNVTLTDVLISDPMVSPITCPSGNPIPSLAPGDSETCTGSYAITQADIDAGQKDNTATAESNETPPVTDDHTEILPAGGIDLAITKIDSIDPVAAGSGPGNLIHVVNVTNNGPSGASGIVISEVLIPPAGVTIDSITPSAGTFAGTTWTLGDLAGGAEATLTVVLTVGCAADPGTNVICDTATVTSVNEPDTDPTNDFATECTSVTAAAYTWINFDSLPVKTVVTDQFPEATFSSDPGVEIQVASPFTDVGSSPPNIICTLNADDEQCRNLVVVDFTDPAKCLSFLVVGVKETGEVAQVEVFENGVLAGTEPVVGQGNGLVPIVVDLTAFNNVTRIEISGVTDPVGFGLDDFRFHSLSSPPVLDLAVTKTDSIDPVVAGSGGGNLTHVATVTNNGPADASGVELSDVLTLPAGVALVSVVPSAGSFDGTTWTLGNLASGAGETLTVTLTVASSALAGTDVIRDTAAVSAVGEIDFNPANDSATEYTSVAREVDLAVTKTDSIDPVAAGSGIGNLVYLVTVTNNGPSAASGVELVDISDLPPGDVTIDSFSPSTGTVFGSTWTLGDLASAASETLAVVLTVGGSALPGTDVICNAAAVSAVGETDVNPANDSAIECTSVTVPSGDEIFSDSFDSGDASAWSFIVPLGGTGTN